MLRELEYIDSLGIIEMNSVQRGRLGDKETRERVRLIEKQRGQERGKELTRVRERRKAKANEGKEIKDGFILLDKQKIQTRL